MEWISIKDRLPESSQVVIAYGHREEGGDLCVAPCQFNSCRSLNLFHCLDEYGDHAGDLQDVTHWMSLPRPPKDQ